MAAESRGTGAGEARRRSARGEGGKRIRGAFSAAEVPCVGDWGGVEQHDACWRRGDGTGSVNWRRGGVARCGARAPAPRAAGRITPGRDAAGFGLASCTSGDGEPWAAGSSPGGRRHCGRGVVQAALVQELEPPLPVTWSAAGVRGAGHARAGGWAEAYFPSPTTASTAAPKMQQKLREKLTSSSGGPS